MILRLPTPPYPAIVRILSSEASCKVVAQLKRQGCLAVVVFSALGPVIVDPNNLRERKTVGVVNAKLLVFEG